ncbi:YhfC family intramembrane metalloprotease [Bacillus massiliglaciei]|uniref:YhfC family intramembrane metalloprotease n=1 Tax=Bacillus massiliglaciei TaxID=1816693 RepID=UPI000A729A2E|nr:YhfC family glutamic-type intramembrane protease [Bacillus massiliglaciei]
MVSNQSIAFMFVSALLAVLVPVGCLICLTVKKKMSWKPFAIGILIYIVFSQVLGSLFTVYWLSFNSRTSGVLQGNPYLYSLYGGLSAAVFEESGRFLGFYFLLKTYREWKDGLSYGLGHGGVEAVLIGGFAGIQNIGTSLMINSGAFDQLLNSAGANASSLEPVREQLINTASYLHLAVGIERVTAFIIQIALSLLILYGIKRKQAFLFVLYAMAIHALVNAVPLLLKELGFSLYLFEGIIVFAAIGCFVFIRKSKRLFQEGRVA